MVNELNESTSCWYLLKVNNKDNMTTLVNPPLVSLLWTAICPQVKISTGFYLEDPLSRWTVSKLFREGLSDNNKKLFKRMK